MPTENDPREQHPASTVERPTAEDQERESKAAAAAEDKRAGAVRKGSRVVYVRPKNGGGVLEDIAVVLAREGDKCDLRRANPVTGRDETLEAVPRWRDDGMPTSPAGWRPIAARKPKTG